jgi:hypothetical protein
MLACRLDFYNVYFSATASLSTTWDHSERSQSDEHDAEDTRGRSEHLPRLGKMNEDDGRW